MTDQDDLGHMAEVMELLIREAIEDVESVVWSLDFEDPEVVVRTRPLDPSYRRQTNVIDLIARRLVVRDLLAREGVEPEDGLSAERVVKLLNTVGAFGMRPMTPSPDFEADPTDFVPTFQLYVETEDDFASLVTPTWYEVGRVHERTLPPEAP